MILATDNFTRANNADLGTAWDENTGLTGTGGFDIVSNQAVPVSATSDSGETNNSAVWPNDQYSQITIGAIDAGGVGAGVGVMCRSAVGATATQYRAVGNGSGWEVGRNNAGSFTSLGNSATVTFAAGNTLRLEVRNDGPNCRWTLKKNGVLVTTGIDTTPIASGSTGIFHSSTTSGASVSAWEGGSLESVLATRPRKRSYFEDGFWSEVKSNKNWF